MALHTQHGSGGGTQRLPRLVLVSDEPWSENPPPADCSWNEYSRRMFWLVRDYLDEREAPKSIEDRIDRAIRAARIGFLDSAYEREDREMEIAIGISARSIERARTDLRAALHRAGKRLPDPLPIPREFER